MPWWERGACHLKVDTEVFFPGKGQNYTKAEQWCGRCPVKRECLDDVMKREIAFHREGMYGGLTPDERDELASGRTVHRRAS